MIVNIPLNLFTIGAMILAFMYIGTHIGAKEHAGWLFSREMFIVLALATMLFCAGLAPDSIWHMLSNVGR